MYRGQLQLDSALMGLAGVRAWTGVRAWIPHYRRLRRRADGRRCMVGQAADWGSSVGLYIISPTLLRKAKLQLPVQCSTGTGAASASGKVAGWNVLGLNAGEYALLGNVHCVVHALI